jgi:hypothetical protein
MPPTSEFVQNKTISEEAFMPAESDTAPYSTLFKAALVAVRDWVRNQPFVGPSAQRFGECDSDEVGRIARDLGLSRTELKQMAKLDPDAANLLLARLDALHLDAEGLAKAEPAVMRDLQRLCSLCASKGRCQRDLVHDSENPVWREYCPNEDTLIALQSGQAADKAKSLEAKGE